MKKIIIIILLSVTVVSLKAQNTTAKKDFNSALSAYFDIKNALATDNVKLSDASAKNLLAGLKTFPVQLLKPTQRTAWEKQQAMLKKHVQEMTTEKDLEVQRKHFESVSSAMIALVRAIGLNNNEIYVQYCPMVKRSWLNEVEDIQNPFYGSKMYDCGEVTDTIMKK